MRVNVCVSTQTKKGRGGGGGRKRECIYLLKESKKGQTSDFISKLTGKN